MPAEVRGRIFEPFYTTKPVGEGTGLGLEIVRRIVEKHKGTILVTSRPGRTAFEVRLPLERTGQAEAGQPAPNALPRFAGATATKPPGSLPLLRAG